MDNPELKKLLETPIFSEETYKYFEESGLTKEEIQVLERAEAASNLTENVEGNIDGLFQKFQDLSDNPAIALDQLNKLAQSNPGEYLKMLSLVQAADMAFEEETKD